MQTCKKCKVKIKSNDTICPLCQNILTGKKSENSFPYIPTIYKKYFTFFRILLLVSVIICSICVAIDILLPDFPNFSIFVVAGFACLIVVLIIALAKRNSVYKSILWQMIILGVIVVLWDYFTGWLGWSITYVIPILCIIGSVNMVIISIVMHSYLEEELIYFICIALIGLIPFIFIATNITTNTLPSIICILLNTICFFGLLIFKWKDVKEELQRRLHI